MDENSRGIFSLTGKPQDGIHIGAKNVACYFYEGGVRFMNHISLWGLKKLPMEEVVDYIRTHGKPELQARMANVPQDVFSLMDEASARSALAGGISRMDDEAYEDCLLEIIDE
jgi:hypothetical protein